MHQHLDDRYRKPIRASYDSSLFGSECWFSPTYAEDSFRRVHKIGLWNAPRSFRFDWLNQSNTFSGTMNVAAHDRCMQLTQNGNIHISLHVPVYTGWKLISCHFEVAVQILFYFLWKNVKYEIASLLSQELLQLGFIQNESTHCKKKSPN